MLFKWRKYLLEDKLILYRIFLIILALLYVLFELLYKLIGIKISPIPLRYKLVMVVLILVIFSLSFINKNVKNNIYYYLYGIILIATIHLIYFAYLNRYSLNYAIILLIAIIVSNLIFEAEDQIMFYNLVTTGLVIISISKLNFPIIDRQVYLFFLILVSFISYVIHLIKFNIKKQSQKTKRKYRQLFEKQKLLLDNIETQVWYLKDVAVYGVVNQAHAQFLGLSKEDIENRNISLLFEKEEVKSYIKSNQQVFNTKERVRVEEWIKNKDGEERLLSITKIPKLNQRGEVEYVVCTAEDITERNEAQKKIEYLTFHDSLTGLYNRRYFEQELQRLDTARQLPLSIIIGDINGLKLTNDAFGHKLGDQLLKEAGQLIQQACRKEDIIARWGGDEFVILLPRTNKGDAAKICTRIKEACTDREVDLIEISISLGYATKEKSTENFDDIFQQAENWMYKKKLKESKSHHHNLIASLKKSLKGKSDETAAHSERIKKLALKMGQALNLSDYKLDDLVLLSELHDLGKVAISEEILQKPTRLNSEEWKEIKKHAEIGCQIVKSTPELSSISHEILSHHEWWNGSGYPQGLKKEEIPLLARIISILDAYDIITNGTSYKEGLSQEEALAEIERGSGVQFDPELVDIFLEVVTD